jgi:tripartite-type tricarboxylate transporter receptor subunit TctC
MKAVRRELLSLVGAAVATFAVAQIATAQGYPSRPVTIVVPYGAGGPTDTISRIMAEGIRASLGQPVVIENVVGASGTIGAGRMAHSQADGYTLGIGNWSTHVLNAAIFHLGYDPLKDFEPISSIVREPLLIVGKKTIPVNELSGLIAWLRANPGKASFGTTGSGGALHVAGVFFQNETGTRLQPVPYRGGEGPAMHDLVAGQIDLMIDPSASSLPQARAGSIKAYAVKRMPLQPKAVCLRHRISRRWTRRACLGSIFRIGMGFGLPRAHQRTSSPNSMPPSRIPWRIRPSVPGSQSLDKISFRSSSRRPRRYTHFKERRSKSGGRSSKQQGSKLSSLRPRAKCRC